MSVRVVPGEISSKNVTTRTVIPTGAQSRWPPFERVAETIATPRRPFPPHGHEGVEVLTYVIEGSALYAIAPGVTEPIQPGTIELLTAPTTVSHAINPAKGQTIRWFALVATLPTGATTSIRLQSGRAVAIAMQPDGTVVRHLVGPRSTLTSVVGLECDAIEFHRGGTSFRRVGHDRVAVLYAISGPGMVDNVPLDAGEAVLVDDAAGVALEGEPGFHVILSSAPRVARA
ncbi:MAG: pirin family protein [Thermoplasmata archaeon]